jgi:colanic acid/amylovoran biosynthesis glycosyltransferase
MGVDAEVFARTTPHPQDGHVVAVGRLVEKKGFADLVRACGRLREEPAFTALTIVGEGPLAAELRALAAACGVQEHVRFAGALAPDAVRALLEEAAVLAMPCVIAADGDRDSMPVVVKEALAMEVPVVATDVVGLPEVVDATCGRLVPPGDPAALAQALREVLRLDAGGRAALGHAGRARVQECCDVGTETRRLVALIKTAVDRLPHR